MAYNGSGTFARLYNWVTDRNNTIKIRADRMDAEMDGFADGLTNAICRDGQSTVAANIPWNNKKITGLGDATADTDAVNRQSGDARWMKRPTDLTAITDLAGTDVFGVTDATDSADKKVTWTTIKTELLAEMTTSFFPSGTRMLFQQTSAPTGWTKDATYNDYAVRITSGTASTGGTVAFQTAFASRSVSGTVGNTTLTTTTIPAHTHTVPMMQDDGSLDLGAGYGTARDSTTSGNSATTSSVGSGSAHNHSFSGTAIDLDVRFVDFIIAEKT